jgi:leucyl-tRNA synthetase
MILGPNGEKMSKSRGNVINPDDVVRDYGADSLRLYEMFMGPLEDAKPWSTTGIDGAKRFIERVYRLVDEVNYFNKITDTNDTKLDYAYNVLVKKVTEDFASLQFNTAISAMMIFINEVYKQETLYRPYIEGFVKMFSCICPHVGEEMWEKLGHNNCIDYEVWPTYDESKLVLATKDIAVQICGKLRAVITIPSDADEKTIEELAFANEIVKAKLQGLTVRKVIVIKGKIVNIVAN